MCGHHRPPPARSRVTPNLLLPLLHLQPLGAASASGPKLMGRSSPRVIVTATLASSIVGCPLPCPGLIYDGVALSCHGYDDASIYTGASSEVNSRKVWRHTPQGDTDGVGRSLLSALQRGRELTRQRRQRRPRSCHVPRLRGRSRYARRRLRQLGVSLRSRRRNSRNEAFSTLHPPIISPLLRRREAPTLMSASEQHHSIPELGVRRIRPVPCCSVSYIRSRSAHS